MARARRRSSRRASVHSRWGFSPWPATPGLGVKAAFNWWKPTGPLSGVTAATCLVWLAAWFVLARLWRDRNVNLAAVNAAAFALLAGGVLLTFPPFMDLLLGK